MTEVRRKWIDDYRDDTLHMGSAIDAAKAKLGDVKMSATDKLMAKLSRVYVPPHVRMYGKKVVNVEGYWREFKGASPSMAPLEGRRISYSTIGGSAAMPQTFRYQHLEDPEGNRIGEISYRFDRDGVDIETIAVNPSYRRQGVAEAMLAKLHEDLGRTLIHGSFSSAEGAALGFDMARDFPEWNKVWTNITPEKTEYWQPGTPIDPEWDTFDPMPFGMKLDWVTSKYGKPL